MLEESQKLLHHKLFGKSFYEQDVTLFFLVAIRRLELFLLRILTIAILYSYLQKEDDNMLTLQKIEINIQS